MRFRRLKIRNQTDPTANASQPFLRSMLGLKYFDKALFLEKHFEHIKHLS